MRKLTVFLLILLALCFNVLIHNALAEQKIGDVAAPGSNSSIIDPPPPPPPPPPPVVVVQEKISKIEIKAGNAKPETAPCVLTGPAVVLDEKS